MNCVARADLSDPKSKIGSKRSVLATPDLGKQFLLTLVVGLTHFGIMVFFSRCRMKKCLGHIEVQYVKTQRYRSNFRDGAPSTYCKARPILKNFSRF
jgi:hypothetical protein